MSDSTTATVPALIEEAPPEFDLEDRVAKERDEDGCVRDEHPIKVPAKTPNVGNRFRPGPEWAGNTKGRAKGTKNKITVQRLLMEAHLRDRLAVNAEDLLERAILMAMGGDPKIMALLLDKLIASPKHAEDEAPKDATVNLTITNHTLQPPKDVTPSKVLISQESSVPGEFTVVRARNGSAS